MWRKPAVIKRRPCRHHRRCLPSCPSIKLHRLLHRHLHLLRLLLRHPHLHLHRLRLLLLLRLLLRLQRLLPHPLQRRLRHRHRHLHPLQRRHLHPHPLPHRLLSRRCRPLLLPAVNGAILMLFPRLKPHRLQVRAGAISTTSRHRQEPRRPLRLADCAAAWVVPCSVVAAVAAVNLSNPSLDRRRHHPRRLRHRLLLPVAIPPPIWTKPAPRRSWMPS